MRKDLRLAMTRSYDGWWFEDEKSLSLSELPRQVKPHQGQTENFIEEYALLRAGDSAWAWELFGIERLGVFPEVFEGIVFALLPGKEVNHKVNGIEDEPPTRLITVAGVNLDLMIFEGFLEGVPQGFEVRVRGAGGDDETVGQGRGIAKIKKFEVLGFFVDEGFAGDAQVLEKFGLFLGCSLGHRDGFCSKVMVLSFS